MLYPSSGLGITLSVGLCLFLLFGLLLEEDRFFLCPGVLPLRTPGCFHSSSRTDEDVALLFMIDFLDDRLLFLEVDKLLLDNDVNKEDCLNLEAVVPVVVLFAFVFFFFQKNCRGMAEIECGVIQ